MSAMGKVVDLLASVVMQAMVMARVAASGLSAGASVIQRLGCSASAHSNALRWMHAMHMLRTCANRIHEGISSYGQACELSLAHPRDKPPNAAKSGISLWILVFLNVSSMPSLHLFIKWRAVVGMRSSKISITRRPADDWPGSSAGFRP